jgi:hypothetical protein
LESCNHERFYQGNDIKKAVKHNALQLFYRIKLNYAAEDNGTKKDEPKADTQSTKLFSIRIKKSPAYASA